MAVKKNTLLQAVKKTLDYFHFFSYSPSPNEIFTYFPFKINKNVLLSILSSLSDYPNKTFETLTAQKKIISKNKLRSVNYVFRILGLIPSLKFLGLSGSIGMMNAQENDDIDIFIITSQNKLWTTRIIVLTLLTFLGKRRKRKDVDIKDKICANLWFDESNLALPKFKRNLYTAHEILQLKPIINKDNTYERFLKANMWVTNFFPNSKHKWKSNKPRVKTNTKYSRSIIFVLFSISHIFFSLVSNVIERILKYIQLCKINKNKTKEIITNTQLWFFPKDFETILRRKKIM